MGLTTSPSSCTECHGNLGAKTSWNPLGHTGTVTGLPSLYIYIYIYIHIYIRIYEVYIIHVVRELYLDLIKGTF